ncbi:MAG: glycerate kinase [Eudoraea sp.]
MNFLVIPDKFKGSLTALEVISVVEKTIIKKYPDALVKSVIASDGGDGFLEAILELEEVEKKELEALDPLGRPINSYYLFNKKKGEAYIELANTSGLVLLNENELDPLRTSSFGTGIQIKDALKSGATKIYIGLGGSATNDGGIGIANALGYRFLDRKGEELPPIGASLSDIVKIDFTELNNKFHNCSFYAVNDVINPLYGKDGATFVYGEQKGANEISLEHLESGLRNLDQVVKDNMHLENAMIKGAGAAGGAAYGLMTFLGAKFMGGTSFILEKAGVPQYIENEKVDYLITGEGKIDSQSLQGKLIDGVLELSKSYKIPVIAICGILEIDKEALYKMGVSKILEIRDKTKPLSYNMENAAELLEKGLKDMF